MGRLQVSCSYHILLCVVVVLSFGVNGQIPNHFRLPVNSDPIGYDVELTVDLERSKFFGTVQISLKANNDSNYVTLNAKELDVSNVALTEDSGRKLQLITYVMQNDSEMVRFNFDSNLRSAHTYQLSIDFAGNITDDLKGLYKSSYYRGTEERFVATTFNAAAYARKIFPCYDEPQLKAKFKLRIFHKPEFRALSNMPVENRSESVNSDNMTVTEFIQSPPMSSYLLAFVVSDFGEIRMDSKFAAHAQLSVINSTRYALNFTRDAIEYLGIFFKRPYQLNKLDIVAIDDFLMGAMENWGLITYKTSRIVYREGLDKTEKLQSVTKIVFHELIHQWFGNEATSAWWSYIWLNEGFTVFLESYVLDKMHPEWRTMDQFLVNEMHSVMERDVLPDTRAMTKPIDTPDQIAGIYDFAVYPKAASIIRMWQSIVGMTVFDDFLLAYLADRSYKAATEEDMIRVLQNTVDKHGLKLPPMKQIVQSWTSNPSFPVVSVNRLANGSAEVTARPSKTFYIPLNWISKSKKSGSEWITHLEGEKLINLKDVGLVEWVIFNPNQFGYYRVNYDQKSWNLFIEALKQDHHQIPTLSRAQLIDDALALAKDNQLNIEILLGILDYIPTELDLIPLKAAFKALRYLNRMLQGNEFFSTYQQYQSNLLAHVYDQMLRNSNDDHVSRLYRVEVREVACELGVHRCLQDALALFEGFVTIDPDLRGSVMCGALKGSEHYDVWALMVRRMVYIVRNFEQKRINVEEFEDILYGFGCVVSEDRLDNYMMLSLSYTETLEEADRIKIFNYIANSGVNGTNMALYRLNNDVKTLKRRYGSVTEIISNLRYAINTPEQLQEYSNFLRNNTDVDLGLLLNDVYNDAQKNVLWAKEKSPVISKWISAHSLAFSLHISRILIVVGFVVAVYPFQ
ncbi:aminopeptidase N-like [Ochlerotatus camptorhynchus]|uniref:aminopeptidase N-like n=1 Tax=Ochlerotatus camptorhynchus TaxID=644619 RepID=UPI0031D537DC